MTHRNMSEPNTPTQKLIRIAGMSRSKVTAELHFTGTDGTLTASVHSGLAMKGGEDRD